LDKYSQHTLGIIASFIAAILWSTGGLGIKLIDYPATSILFYRSLFAAALFLIIYRRRALLINRYSLAGSLLYVGLVYCFVNSTKLTTAANAIFLQYTAPMLVLILEPKLLGTIFQKKDGWTVLFCMLGMSMFLLEDLSIDNQVLGMSLGLMSSIFLALFILIQRANNSTHAESSILLGNILVTLIMMPQVDIGYFPTGTNLMILLWLGLFQIALGYIFFNYGQRRLKAIESSIIAFMEPILNPIWVIIGYGERPGFWAVIGGGIIILTLFWRTLVSRRRREVIMTHV
jgi:drug/metabolite transporter (DMT)-like permease